MAVSFVKPDEDGVPSPLNVLTHGSGAIEAITKRHQPPRNHVSIFGPTQANGDVCLMTLKADGANVRRQIDIQAGIEFGQSRQSCGEIAMCKRGGSVDPYQSTRRIGHIAPPYHLGGSVHVTCRGHHLSTRRRQCIAVRAPLHELLADARFERPDAAGYSRMVDTQCPRRGRQAAMPSQREKDPDILPIGPCVFSISHCAMIANFRSDVRSLLLWSTNGTGVAESPPNHRIPVRRIFARQGQRKFEMSTDRKVAVVTGASQGLGAGIVRALRDRGYRVAATSRSIQPSQDPDLLAIKGDIGDPATGKKVIDAALAAFGRIDTLVNNAGIFIASPFTDYSEDQYRAKLSTNLDGFFFITQHAIAAMEKQGSGHIVQITTTLADQANSNVPSVLAALTKGGLNAATRSLAIEYATRGIRVNAVSPGVIRTPMHAPEMHEALAALHPVNRLGEVEDIVQAVLYLEDAHFVTGEILHVDGGQVAGH